MFWENLAEELRDIVEFPTNEGGNMEEKIPLDYYLPGEPVKSGEGLLPKKGEVLGEHRVKGVVQNYHGRTVVVLEPLPR